MRLCLSACPPFSLWSVVESHGWSRLPPFSVNRSAGMLSRVERLESGRVVDLLIEETAGGVSVEVRHPLSGPEREEVSRKVWWMLSLGENLAPFYEQTRQEPKLAHVERRALGRMLRSSTVFEDLLKTLLTININWAGTIRMAESLVARFGDPLPTDPSRNAFPTPAQLAAAGEDELRAAGLGYRALRIAELARQVHSGQLDLEQLKDGNCSASDVRAKLLQIKGVGEYTAAMLLMLLGHYEYIPVDSWARKLVSQEWRAGQPAASQDVESTFEHWGRWKGLAYWFWNWTFWEQDK